jgi:ParB-like chromosome segregation protein Spo0J
VITYGQEKHKNIKTTTITLSSNPNMKSELIAISKVKANPNNPRIIKDEKFKKLVKSIQEFPQMLEIRPIVVNEEMIVLGGNMRLKACQEAGLKEVAIIKATDLTEEQQKEFIIKDNVGFGEWDWNDLANNWDSDKLENWGLDIPGFENIEEKEQDDLSDKIKSEFRIEIILKDEKEQEITYNKLIGEGYECRLLTL